MYQSEVPPARGHDAEDDTIAGGLVLKLLLATADAHDGRALEGVLARGCEEAYRLEVVTDLEQTWELIAAREPPDCVIVDATSGFDLASLMHRLGKFGVKIPVVALLGNHPSKSTWYAAGVQECLPWSGVTAEALYRSIQLAIERGVVAELSARAERAESMAAIGQLASSVALDITQPLAFVLANLSELRMRFDDIARFVERIKKDETTSDEEQLIDRALGANAYEVAIGEANEIITESMDGLRRISALSRELRAFGEPRNQERGAIDLAEIARSSGQAMKAKLRARTSVHYKLVATPRVPALRGPLIEAVSEIIADALERFDRGTAETNQLILSTSVGKGTITLGVEDNAPTGPEESSLGSSRSLALSLPAKLASAKRLVEREGGRLLVQRAEVGRLVRLVFPELAVLDSLPKDSMGHFPAAPDSDHRRRRVLLVDDDPAVLRAYERVLRHEFDVETTNDAEHGLELIEDPGHFDFVLCDLMMPSLDGPGFFERLKVRAPELARHVAFCSGGTFTPRLKQFLDQLPNPILDKPVAPSLLVETARRLSSPEHGA